MDDQHFEQDQQTDPQSKTNPQSGNPPQDDSKKPQNEGQDLQKLQQELEETRTRLDELTTISQQALADLQNYKKRNEDEKQQFVKFANAALILQILPILDNIALAEKHLPENPDAQKWAEGVLSTVKQLEDLLAKDGLNKISTEDLFDPDLHEAVTMQPGPKDQIMQTMETGYKIGERVLRRAKVIVGNGESAATAS